MARHRGPPLRVCCAVAEADAELLHVHVLDVPAGERRVTPVQSATVDDSRASAVVQEQQLE